MIFYFRLARELGMTVGHLLRTSSSKEITGWMAFLSWEDREEKRKKRKESASALSAHLDTLGAAAEKKLSKKEKWRQANLKLSGTAKQ